VPALFRYALLAQALSELGPQQPEL
jgi:hypothetical protein